MTTYLLNAFPNALLVPKYVRQTTTVERISESTAKDTLWAGFESAIGHDSTANVISVRLGIDVKKARINVVPQNGDTLIIAAFTPPRRLEEGELFSEQEILSFDLAFCRIIWDQ
jgi:hypothetical protein